MSPEAPARVWLIEDNADYRETVARALARTGRFECPGRFPACEDALAALGSGAPAPRVILLDLGLPGMGGLAGLPRLKAAAPGADLAVLTVFDDDDKVFRALAAGAVGYLLKSSSAAEIAAALGELLAGGSPVNPRVARRLLETFARTPTRPDYGLTPRERDILELVVEGLLKKEIAARLGVSPHTVDTHLRRIYEKLQVNSRSGAVAKALREGLL